MVKNKKEFDPLLLATLVEINKKYGAGTIGVAGKMETLTLDRIPSGITQLDEALGGGFPRGRIIELYGHPSAGKGLIALKLLAEAQKQNLTCVYMDVEGTFDPVFAKGMGVNPDKLIVSNLSIGEDLLDVLVKILKSHPAIVVIDSVAAMTTKAELEGRMEDIQMAPKARLLSKALAILNLLKKETMLIFINQLRSTMIMYGNPNITPGGRALPHYASLRIEVKKDTQLIRKDKKMTGPVIGQRVNFVIQKNKTAAPFKTGSFEFYYDTNTIQ